MKIIKVDRKNNYFEVVPDSFDDLWHLERLIEKGDLVSGSSERKIKPKTEGEKAFKQKVFVELEVEKAEFHEPSNQLRIQGIVVSAKPEELVELKSHHTIEAEPGTALKIKKKSIKNYHIERLEKAKETAGRKKLLIVVMDDEAADLASLKDSGFETRARIIANKEGKRFQQNEKGKPYFEELLKKITELGANAVVIAGPGFERQNFEKFLKDKSVKLPASFESTNSVGITGLNELIKSGKIDALVRNFQSAQEEIVVEKLFSELGKNGAAAIGPEEVKKAAEAGAIQEIIVEENFMTANRGKTETILELVERLNGKIHFVNEKNEAGKKIAGIGGIAALLRYKMKW
ncbi:MAG: mRNA surveillance protein pelota [archaeon]